MALALLSTKGSDRGMTRLESLLELKFISSSFSSVSSD